MLIMNISRHFTSKYIYIYLYTHIYIICISTILVTSKKNKPSSINKETDLNLTMKATHETHIYLVL